MASYWDLRTSKLSRRRVIGGAAASGLGLAALSTVGCGGGDEAPDDGSGSGAYQLHKPQDTTSSPTQGGILRLSSASDTVSLDAIGGTSASSREVGNYAYSRLLQFAAGRLEPSSGEIEPHLARSWEITDGGSTLILKLRPEAKFDARAPTNGKQVTSADVAYSWEKFSRLGIQRAELIQAANPSTPFPSQVETPDAQTVVFRLAFPWTPALAMLATGTQFVVMPTESESAFDPKGEVRGSGAWTIEHRASIGTEYRRNPNWWGRTLVDGISAPLVPEYATRLSQFRAGGIWDGVVRQEDIIQTKSDLPDLWLTQQEDFPVSTGTCIFFGYQDQSPFKDDRIRKAVSLAIDRDLYTEIVYGLDNFTAVGLRPKTAWNSHVSVGWSKYWLDPQDDGFGTNAKFFKHDIAEAKKLMAAAGYANGVQSTAFISSINNSNTVPLLLGMLDEAGIRTSREVVDYSTNWLPKIFYGHGDHDGLTINAQYSSPEIGVELLSAYHSQGARTHHPAGLDSRLDKMIEDQFKEFDEDRRVSMIQEIQRYLADKMYLLFGPGDSLSYGLTWPVIGNHGVYRLWPGSLYTNASQVLNNYWITDDQMRQAT